ncbi:MAG: AAA family ATPase, partial [Burkholderiales bacterium]|nr:AAA family ATPase [Burkholderiales bacterium]
MDNVPALELPLGTSSFEALRQANQIYVDKTDIIYSLACKRAKYFLARPRRFGKSLLVSTFESLFKKGTAEFKGLKIENLWAEKRTFSVITLDFFT